MRTEMMTFISLALGAQAVFAHGTIVVRSDVQAQVFLDQQFMGVTPLLMKHVAHGTHIVTMRCLMGTGVSESVIVVPRGETASTVYGSFMGFQGRPFAPSYRPERRHRHRDQQILPDLLRLFTRPGRRDRNRGRRR